LLNDEFYGPGPLVLNNAGTVWMVKGSLESNIKSIHFEHPEYAYLPGTPGITVEQLITELLDAEGSGIRSAFDLAKKTLLTSKNIKVTLPMVESQNLPGSYLLRCGKVYNDENISPAL